MFSKKKKVVRLMIRTWRVIVMMGLTEDDDDDVTMSVRRRSARYRSALDKASRGQ